MVKTQGVCANAGIFAIKRLEQDRDQRSLPVVAVEQVGLPQDLRCFEHRATEQGKALRVVVVIAQWSPVQRVAVEKRRIVDKIDLHSITNAAVQYGAESIAIVERDRDTPDRLAWVVDFRQSITRKVDGYFVPDSCQFLGEGPHHVSEAAGLRKRNAFGRCERDMHGTSRLGRLPSGNMPNGALQPARL